MEQIALVEEKVNQETMSYTATIDLTNSKKVGFTRRDLALCFYPNAVVSKADRHYEVITIDGRILPFDNQRLVQRMWEIVQQKYIYTGVVKKQKRHSFDWAKIIRRLKRDYVLTAFHVAPERHTIISRIQITTATSDFNEHSNIINNLRKKLRQNASHLTFTIDCIKNKRGACPVNPLET